LILGIAVSTLGSPDAWGADWKKCLENDRHIWFYDVESLRRDWRSLSVWLRVVHKTPVTYPSRGAPSVPPSEPGRSDEPVTPASGDPGSSREPASSPGYLIDVFKRKAMENMRAQLPVDVRDLSQPNIVRGKGHQLVFSFFEDFDKKNPGVSTLKSSQRVLAEWLETLPHDVLSTYDKKLLLVRAVDPEVYRSIVELQRPPKEIPFSKLVLEGYLKPATEIVYPGIAMFVSEEDRVALRKAKTLRRVIIIGLAVTEAFRTYLLGKIVLPKEREPIGVEVMLEKAARKEPRPSGVSAAGSRSWGAEEKAPTKVPKPFARWFEERVTKEDLLNGVIEDWRTETEQSESALLLLMRFDCKERKVSCTKYALSSKDGEILHENDPPFGRFLGIDIPPGAPLGDVYRKLCKPKGEG